VIRRAALAMALALASGACAATGTRGDPAAGVEVVFRAAMCGDTSKGPAVTWIGTASALRAVYKRIVRHQTEEGAGASVPVDFSSRAVVWVQMGMQPSAGYGLSLQDPAAEIDAGTLTLHMKWLAPSPDRVYAQVVTRPCLLVAVPRADYDRVRVRDQQGSVRMEAEVPQQRAPVP